MSSLKVGVGRGRITPPVGAMLMGYAPARAAETVHDELAVTAIALEQGQVKALLISADVCVIKDPQSTHFRTRISEATGVPFDNIILSATHTHSGPAMRATPGGADLDEAYLNSIFEPQAVDAAAQAVDTLRSARMGVATALSDVGVNRRQIDPSGNVQLGQNPWGCFDPTMTVIGFRGTDDAPIANLIHYGAHCTAAGKNVEVTRDWAGPMVDRLEAESGALTVFFNGAEGDCGPRLPNGKTTGGGDIRFALELGARAGIEAGATFRTIKEFRDVDVRVVSDRIRLPYEPLPAPESVERTIDAMGPPDKLVGLRVMSYKALCARLEESRAPGPHATHLELRQSVVSVGPVAFVPFPFEVFSEITLRLRDGSPFQHTLSLSNANGSYFYFPSQDQIARGGYEVSVFKSMNPRALADDADNAALTENLRLLETLATAQ
ncbi:MAG: neutral/alkaline non-lysosomal ceramidase N-terminal domain-containing protein [Candidatus Pacebacteria bacterium]|nr:neutral/alkaline non-lysosomal ceramidase N-terminal domain-containing protein [Candidatus Paceibacterota bacterium]